MEAGKQYNTHNVSPKNDQQIKADVKFTNGPSPMASTRHKIPANTVQKSNPAPIFLSAAAVFEQQLQRLDQQYANCRRPPAIDKWLSDTGDAPYHSSRGLSAAEQVQSGRVNFMANGTPGVVGVQEQGSAHRKFARIDGEVAYVGSWMDEISEYFPGTQRSHGMDDVVFEKAGRRDG